MNEQIYTNYRLQLPDQEMIGTLVVRDGLIADIQPGIVSQGEQGNGNYLLPGLIELHTDNLERCISPRPGIRWPRESAGIYHDRDIAAAGITTVCDAIAIGGLTPGSPRLTDFTPIIEVVTQGQTEGKFSVDHRLHLRCELAYEHVCQIAETYIHHPLLSLLSLMDHTPGQRQFTRIDKFKEYYMGKHGVSTSQIDNLIDLRQKEQTEYAYKHRQTLVELAQRQGICLASHDDATVEHIQEAVKDGVAIAEFPTTLEAAKEAHVQGLKILMGAPNLVLGKSHSGNISAMELVELDLVDIISSDYVPHSLLHSAFMISQRTGKPLYKAIATITINPAKAIKLDHDRGSLEIGKRADLLIVPDDGVVPRLTAVFQKGLRIA